MKNLLPTLSNNTTFKFDVIGLPEIFKPSQLIDYTIQGYHKPIFKTRDENDDCHGGVGLYIKDTIPLKERSDLSVFIPHIIESLFVEITIGSTNIILGVIYRPNTAPRADLDIFTTTLYNIN